MHRATRTIAMGIILALGLAHAAQAQDVYLTDSPDIKIANGCCTASTFFSGGSPSAVAVDATNGKIYWASGGGPFAIRRANLDGTGVEVVVTGSNLQNTLTGVAVDAVAGKVYWGDRDFSTTGSSRINRADVAGLDSSLEHIAVGGTIQRIALDPAGDLYWADSGAGQIRRISISGVVFGTPTVVWSGQAGATGIALDTSAHKIYWSIQSDIRWANDDSTGVVETLPPPVPPAAALVDVRSLAVDGCGGKLYYADVSADKVSRANLDGTVHEPVVTGGVPNLGDIAVDDCGDGNTCTDDVCMSGVCQHDDNTATCEDGNPCTGPGTCANGICVTGPPVVCNDNNVCTDDTCEEGVCVYTPNSNGCDDGDVCTDGDACTGGVCSGSPQDCSFLDGACSTGVCNSGTGACEAQPANAVDALGTLAMDVMALNLQNGISNSLDKKLENAIKALDDMNANNDVAAFNKLAAFQNEVDAQRGNWITDAEADALIATSAEILTIIDPEGPCNN